MHSRGPGSRSGRQQGDSRGGNDTEHGDRGSGCARWQHQLEERHRITNAIPQSSQRTISLVGGHKHSLSREGTDCRSQQPSTAAADRAPPDVEDRAEKDGRNQCVSHAPSDHSRRQTIASSNRQSGSHAAKVTDAGEGWTKSSLWTECVAAGIASHPSRTTGGSISRLRVTARDPNIC